MTNAPGPSEPAPPAGPRVPRPLRPGERPDALRVSDVAIGLTFGFVLASVCAVVGGAAGAAIGSLMRGPQAFLVGASWGVWAGGLLGPTGAMAVAWRRHAAPGYRVGLALVLGLTGLLASTCYLGAW